MLDQLTSAWRCPRSVGIAVSCFGPLVLADVKQDR